MRLLLARHGQTTSNLEHRLDTADPGAALTDLGQQQARALVDTLAGERIDAIFASTLLRAQQTAAPIAADRGLTVCQRAGIREIVAGDLEMHNDDEAVRTYIRTAFGWAAGEVAVQMPGGGTGTDMLDAFDAVVAEAEQVGGPVLLVSHGAALRTWIAARAGNVDVAYVAERPLANTAVVVVDGSSADGWQVRTWSGDTVPASDPTGAPLDA